MTSIQTLNGMTADLRCEKLEGHGGVHGTKRGIGGGLSWPDTVLPGDSTPLFNAVFCGSPFEAQAGALSLTLTMHARHIAHLVGHQVDKTTIIVAKNRYGDEGTYRKLPAGLDADAMQCACKEVGQSLRPCGLHSAHISRVVDETTKRAQSGIAGPIPMLLWCPECGDRHVDAGEYTTCVHHTHACQTCGHAWRPAVVPTVGVQFLPGFKDKP